MAGESPLAIIGSFTRSTILFDPSRSWTQDIVAKYIVNPDLGTVLALHLRVNASSRQSHANRIPFRHLLC